MQNTQQTNSTLTTSFANASGNIDYKLTNDYMFRAMLQENKPVLTALICALLHLQLEDVISIELMNLIELGRHIENKDFVLDIKVSFNDNTLINFDYSDSPVISSVV